MTNRLLGWLLALALAGGAQADNLPAGDKVRILEQPVAVGDFTLTDQNGAEFAFSQLRNRIVLVVFGFTHCPDVCPATMSRIKSLIVAHPDALNDVAVVLISVDGDRDTPSAMKAFLAQFSGEFLGLMGDPRLVRSIAARFRAVFFKGHPHDASGDYTVSHSAQIFVIDRDGQLRAEFYGAELDAMAAVSESLQSEQRSS